LRSLDFKQADLKYDFDPNFWKLKILILEISQLVNAINMPKDLSLKKEEFR
jgi:hypothetical protein